MRNAALILLAIVLNAAAQIALKKSAMDSVGGMSARDFMGAIPRLLFNPWVMLAMALYAISVLNWLFVLSRMELSVAYPLMSAVYVITLVAGVLLFHEPVNATRVCGIAVIILGIVLLTRPVHP